MALTVHSGGHFFVSNGSYSSVPIPAAMLPGDLLLFMASNLTGAVSDTRIGWLTNYSTIPRVAIGYWWSPVGVPIDFTPIAAAGVDSFPFGYAQWTTVLIRGVTSIGDEAYSDLAFVSSILQSVNVPPLSSRAAIAMLYGQATGFVPSPMVASTAWQPQLAATHARISLGLYLWQSPSGDPEPIDPYGFKQTGSTGGRIRGFVVPLDVYIPPVEPDPDDLLVVRQWPRDDARGCSSAPRLWPSPRTHRIAGGYPGGSGT